MHNEPLLHQREREQRVDDAIDAWHVSGPDETRELHEYLGWTWDEYGAYVERNVLPPEREGAV